MNQIEHHVKLLSVFHYVLGGMTALVSCVPFIHVAVGIWMLGQANHPTVKGEPPPEAAGWMMIGLGALAILIGWTISSLIIAAGRSLAHRRRLTFCQVVAGIECMMMPLGTALGIFSLIVLTKAEARALFDGAPPPA